MSVPAAPLAPGLTADGAAVDVAWVQSSGATVSRVMRSIDNATWTKIAANLSGASGTYVDAAPPTTPTIYYAVQGGNASGFTQGPSAAISLQPASSGGALLVGACGVMPATTAGVRAVILPPPGWRGGAVLRP